MKSGNLNFLEPSGPLRACNGTALPFTFRTQLSCSDNVNSQAHSCRQGEEGTRSSRAAESKGTYLLIPWNRALLEELIGSKLVKKFPAIYRT